MAIKEIKAFKGDSNWQNEAACSTVDPELFFHPQGERGYARERRTEAARDVCATCPVIVSCDLFSYNKNITDGTWAGLAESERAQYYPKTRKEDVLSTLSLSPKSTNRRRSSASNRKAS